MTQKEIAKKLRSIAKTSHPKIWCQELANQLDPAGVSDPPNPEPGTVVWWRLVDQETFRLGVVDEKGDGIISSDQEFYDWLIIEYKPAHILAPNEVAVKIPLVSRWPYNSSEFDLRYSWHDDQNYPSTYTGITITREEALQREKEL